jgi:multidrug efflux pump subunit AcrB
MNFSAWSIRRPVPAILLFVLLTALGMLGFNRMGIQNMPDINFPAVLVTAGLEGAAPAQLETEVARKIEAKLSSLNQLNHIETKIADGSVNIFIIFKVGKDLEEALGEVRSAVDSTRADLPAAMPPPNVTKVNANDDITVAFTVEAPQLDEQELSWVIDNDIGKMLLAVPGVSAVQRVGGVNREIHVDLDPAAMASLNVSPVTVSAQLRAIERDTSGGRGEVGGARQSVRTLGAAKNVADIAALTLPLGDGRRIRLDQIAQVSDTIADRSSLAYLDGKPVVGFQINRSRGYSDVSVGAGVRQALEKFGKVHPQIQVREPIDYVAPIQQVYDASMQLLIEGAVLAVAVVLLFLRSMRATLVAATALPLSIIPTFAVMQLCGYSLNFLTLLALAMVVGILVDDAIVEIENISRHMRSGKSPMQAAIDAADEIGLAVVATSLTLVAVFLPTAFLGGVAGLFFRQFGITAATAVLMSLLVARLLTPMMAAYVLKPEPAEEEVDGPVMRRYIAVVELCLRRRKTTLAVAGAVFAGSLALIPLIPTEFFPPDDDGRSRVILTLPPGSNLEQTRAIATQAAQIIRRTPEVRSIYTLVGEAAAAGDVELADVGTARLRIVLSDRHDRPRTRQDIEKEWRVRLQELPGVRVRVADGGDGATMSLTLGSDDPESLVSAAVDLERGLRTLQGIGNVTSSAELQRPEVQIIPDFARSAALGVSVADLSDLVRVATYGEFATQLPKLNLPQRQLPIRVRLAPEARRDLALLGELRLPVGAASVSLASVADLRMGSGPAQIARLDRERQVTLTVELNGRTLGELNKEAMGLPAIKNLPPHVHLVEYGDLQQMQEMFSSFGIAMAIGALCMFSVLVLLFHDFLQPFTILSAVPLSISGALGALIVTGAHFSMATVIGLILLMGVVTKNSILLVEYAVVSRHRLGIDRVAALLLACRKRARPIIMTTIALTVGMLPVALGTGASDTFRQNSAIVVIGGTMVSTFLSLLVVPVIYTYVDDLENFWRRLRARFSNASPSSAHPDSPPVALTQQSRS